MPEQSVFEVELAIEELKCKKSSGTDQIPSELIKAGGRTICYQIHKLIISIWNKDELPEEWKQSIIVPIYKNGDKTGCSNYRGSRSLYPSTRTAIKQVVVIIGAYHFCQLHTKFYPISCCQG